MVCVKKFLGWHHIQRNRSKVNTLRLTALKEEIKGKESRGNKMMNFDICHHCKHLFERTILAECKYKASTMGLPIYSYIVTDPFLFVQSK